ncbi:MAG TPA: phospholipase D-like domain-containing protein [Thermoleophilia bacterium]|nr:phospholipase D-like domain-containing protein [Thermoleophilia bacterium]
MRFKSATVDGFCVYAVAGVNTVSFAIDACADARTGLLGFTVERLDPAENELITMSGFKVFRSIIPDPRPEEYVSTRDHPVQSFVWDDFSAKPGRSYTYSFRPLRGVPYQLDRTAAPVTIMVRTEPLYTTADQDVFFNRGVASSQAYARKFGNVKPDDLEPAEKATAALEWLTRDLDDAILKFIASAGEQDSLLCCFYEFHYPPVLEALAAAAGKVRRLSIIIDAKENGGTGKDGKLRQAFPRAVNLAAIQLAGIPAACVIERTANPSAIQHNKFMVILRGEAEEPTDVWTGSTNISEGGVSGQTNVGHWVRDRATAGAFLGYWKLLVSDPGSHKGDSTSVASELQGRYRHAVEELGTVPVGLSDIPTGVSAVFSPRSTPAVLDLYAELMDGAGDLSCVTLAFGVSKVFKDRLKDNTPDSHLTFLLLDKKDVPAKFGKAAFVRLSAANNVYEAWGSYIREAVYQWVRETNMKLLGVDPHVAYIHSKFLLRDPLGLDPIVVTGSANFSEASTTRNDENMIIIRGNQRVADIYFTEFNRLFNHYYFRSVTESAKKDPARSALFLGETPDEWLKKYAPGTLRTKRVMLLTKMQGVQDPPSV